MLLAHTLSPYIRHANAEMNTNQHINILFTLHVFLHSNIILSHVGMDLVQHKQVFSVDVFKKWKECLVLCHDNTILHRGLPQDHVQQDACTTDHSSRNRYIPQDHVQQDALTKDCVPQDQIQQGVHDLNRPVVSYHNKGKESNNEESVDIKAPESIKFILKTYPQLGYHLPTSFAKRIWSNVMSLW